MNGFSIQDLDLKVDSDGCIDLSGILKVTAGCGKSVSLAIMSGKKEIFKKESQVEIRELRLLTEAVISSFKPKQLGSKDQ